MSFQYRNVASMYNDASYGLVVFLIYIAFFVPLRHAVQLGGQRKRYLSVNCFVTIHWIPDCFLFSGRLRNLKPFLSHYLCLPLLFADIPSSDDDGLASLRLGGTLRLHEPRGGCGRDVDADQRLFLAIRPRCAHLFIRVCMCVSICMCLTLYFTQFMSKSLTIDVYFLFELMTRDKNIYKWPFRSCCQTMVLQTFKRVVWSMSCPNDTE